MNGLRQYQNVQVMTADRVRIIIMLYEGIIRFNNHAGEAIIKGDIKSRANFINRSTAILSELVNSLNMEEGGEIASKLLSLYEFCIQQLAIANLRNDPAPLEVVNKIVAELKGGWEGIERTREPDKMAEAGAGVTHGA